MTVITMQRLLYYSLLSAIMLLVIRPAFPGNGLKANDTDLMIGTVLSQHYDQVLRDAVSKYMEVSRMMISTRVEVRSTLVTSGESPVNQSLPPDVELPGVPRVPGFMLRGTDQVATSAGPLVVNNDIAVSRITVRVLADVSVNDLQRGLIRDIIIEAGKLDVSRGDNVTFIDTFFPERPDAVVIPPAITIDNVEASAPQFISTRGLFALGGMGLIFLLSGSMMAWVMHRRFRPVEGAAQVGSIPQMVPQEPLPMGAGADTAPNTVREPALLQENRSDLLPELARIMNKYPGITAKLFTYWLKRDTDEGPDLAADLLTATGNEMFYKLSSWMSGNDYSKIELAMERKQNRLYVKPSRTQELEAIAQQLIRMFRPDALIVKWQPLGEFAFLDEVDDETLEFGLMQLSGQDAALVMAHLNNDRSRVILSRLQESHIGIILNELPYVMELSLQEYLRVAAQLSALCPTDVSSKPDGEPAKAVADVISSLDPDMQQRFMEEFDGGDELQRVIRSQIVTLAEVEALGDEALAAVALSMDADLLMIWGFGIGGELGKRLLQTRSMREQGMLQSKFERRGAEVTTEDRKRAQARLIELARIYVLENRRTIS